MSKRCSVCGEPVSEASEGPGRCAECGTSFMLYPPLDTPPEPPEPTRVGEAALTSDEASLLAGADGVSRICPCGATRETGQERCRYCNRPAAVEFTLQWPWGETVAIRSCYFVGRVPPAGGQLAERLEAEFPDVSRMHAEFFIEGERLWLRDFGSTNGTWFNGEPLEPFQPRILEPGDRVRFAAALEIVVSD